MSGRHPHDIYESVTRSLIAAIESKPGEWIIPWRQTSGGLKLPLNAASKRSYHGINTVVLWVIAQQRGYASPLWATYKQWLELGAQVRKGEKSSLVVFYKSFKVEPDPNIEGDDGDRRTARSFTVFNAAQVDDFADPTLLDDAPPKLFKRVEAAEHFVDACAPRIVYDGDRAFYRPSTDQIHLPPPERFTGSETMNAGEAFAATKLHELVHWSGAVHRLAREFGKRFADEAYAFEELIAEIATSMLMAELAITAELRPDHAQYVAHWLAILKSDKRAIFTAAAKAQEAVEYLKKFQTPHAEANEVPIAA
jgi:antirestriction protein ArdC